MACCDVVGRVAKEEGTVKGTGQQEEPALVKELGTVLIRGVPFHSVSLEQAAAHVLEEMDSGRGGWVVTTNLDHMRRLGRDADFREVCERASLRVADGAPIVWVSRLVGEALPGRVAGSDLVPLLVSGCAVHGRRVFFLGGDPGVAERAAAKFREQNPGLVVAGTLCPLPGFEVGNGWAQSLAAAINASGADVVFVALGSPKQEYVIDQVRGNVGPSVWWLGVGITLSFVSGDVRRAPAWMRVWGLEWAHRLVQEPRRLARRYLVDGLPYALGLLVWGLRERLVRTFRSSTAVGSAGG